MSKSTIQVTILRSTAKAHLVARIDDESVQGWIQARWLRADGTVNADTFEKAAETARAIADEKASAEAFKNGYHTFGAPARETEKAIGFDVEIDYIDIERDARGMVWFPKSQVRDDQLPGWLINAKISELRAQYRGRGSVGLKVAALNVNCFA